jgi:L-ornithine N5-oxygenase
MRTSQPENGRETAAASGDPDTYDVIGIGFGPANLALAVCLEEAAEEPGGRELARLFLESKPKAAWHPGMLLEDSLLQVSVLKDLVTVRNPRSYFTFLNYLKAKGRLFEFLNLRDLFPTRIEFNDYLSWVAGELRERVRYGREVVSLEPVPGAGGDTVELLRVVTRNIATNKTEELLARNVVLATGGHPCAPQGIQLTPGGRAFHASEFLHRMRQDFPDKQGKHRFVVVGSGQSGAELFFYLLNHYPNAEVTAAIRRYAYKPVDDSDFTNEIFFPQMVDYLYELPDEKRQIVLDQCKDVNYAVVDLALIRRIYRCLYQEKVEGKGRARIRGFLHLTGLEERPGSVVARFEHLIAEQPLQIEADAVVVATGYSWKREHPLLTALSSYIVRTPKGAYKIERDYRLATEPGFLPRLYLQGFAEDTHGASEPVLSLLPIRAGDIVKSLSAAAAPQVLPEPAGQGEAAVMPTF